MIPCKGCKHLVMLRNGQGVCRWPERHGTWETFTDPLTLKSKSQFRHADGTVEGGAVWRPAVEKEREEKGRCGPEARNYELGWIARLMGRHSAESQRIAKGEP